MLRVLSLPDAIARLQAAMATSPDSLTQMSVSSASAGVAASMIAASQAERTHRCADRCMIPSTNRTPSRRDICAQPDDGQGPRRRRRAGKRLLKWKESETDNAGPRKAKQPDGNCPAAGALEKARRHEETSARQGERELTGPTSSLPGCDAYDAPCACGARNAATNARSRFLGTCGPASCR